jgi:hypothetical protein
MLILRVDDIGQDVDQTLPDIGLAYFKKWYEAGNWFDLPVYLGVVPQKLSAEDIVYLLDLEQNHSAVICLHGWSHIHQRLTRDHIRMASNVFPKSRMVIPPYNLYSNEAINATAELGTKKKPGVLFGGFDGEHHIYGEGPIMIGDCLHYPAYRPFYAHARQVVDAIKSHERKTLPTYPLVITLHHRWDHDDLDSVRLLRDTIAPYLVSVDSI